MITDKNILASKRTEGNWFYQEDSDVYTHIVRPEDKPGAIICHLGQDTSGEYEANARLISAAPEAIEFIADLLHEMSSPGTINGAYWVKRGEEILKKGYNL